MHIREVLCVTCHGFVACDIQSPLVGCLVPQCFCAVGWRKVVSKLLPHLGLLKCTAKQALEIMSDHLSFLFCGHGGAVSHLVIEQTTLSFSIFICKMDIILIPASYDGNED